MIKSRLPLVALVAAGTLPALESTAATYVVTSTSDGLPGSFRARVAEANASPGTDTITFNVTGTINIDTPINIADDLVMDGPGPGVLTISSTVTTGTDALLLDADARSDLTLRILDLTLQQAPSSTRRLIRANSQQQVEIINVVMIGNGNEILNSSGGAIAAEGTSVALSDCEIRNFSTTYRGAGVLVRATGTDSANLNAVNCLFEDNATRGDSGDTGASRHGGAIAAERVGNQSATVLNIRNSSFIGNATTEDGGAVYSNDSVTIESSYFAGNTASSGRGGALALDANSNATASVSDSILSGNSASGGGGISLVVRDITIERTTLSSNQADYGGGLFHFIIGTVDMVNSTVSGNTATLEGGGIHLVPTGPGATDLNLLNVTVTGNSAPVGSGILNDDDEAVITAVNGVIAGNSGGGDVAGAISASYSLIGDSPGDTTGAIITELAAGTNILNTPPLLGPLADNGGQDVGYEFNFPMRTHAVLANSPLIGAGDASASFIGLALPATDQRGAGFPRVRNGGLEMGAVESGGGGGGGGGTTHPASLLLLALLAGRRWWNRKSGS